MAFDHFHGLSCWTVLNTRNRSVGVFNFRILHLTLEIEGFVVSSFGAGNIENPIFLASLRFEHEDVTKGYGEKVPKGDSKYIGDPISLRRVVPGIDEKCVTLFDTLLSESNYDEGAALIGNVGAEESLLTCEIRSTSIASTKNPRGSRSQ